MNKKHFDKWGYCLLQKSVLPPQKKIDPKDNSEKCRKIKMAEETTLKKFDHTLQTTTPSDFERPCGRNFLENILLKKEKTQTDLYHASHIYVVVLSYVHFGLV